MAKNRAIEDNAKRPYGISAEVFKSSYVILISFYDSKKTFRKLKTTPIVCN